MMSTASKLALSVLCALPMGAITLLPLATPPAQAANRVQLSFAPSCSRYARGANVRITATVLDSNRRPIAGTPLLIREIFSNNGRTGERSLGNASTNAYGQFRLSYQVPTDPNKDKVTVIFVNPVANGDSASWVIPIARDGCR